MYVNPIILPQVTNREDGLIIMSIFDDDFNTPVNLSGTTTVGNQAYTGSAWTVVDGAIQTSSNTTITIPALPIGNQLSALSLTVGTGLAINSGDPITITDAVVGKNSMIGYVLSYSSVSGTLVVQIGMAFQFEIRKQQSSNPNSYGYGYSGYPALGTYDDEVPEVTAALGTYITIIDIGYVQINIPESVMKTLKPGMRRASLTMTDSVNTRQIFLAQWPIFSGGVTN